MKKKVNYIPLMKTKSIVTWLLDDLMLDDLLYSRSQELVSIEVEKQEPNLIFTATIAEDLYVKNTIKGSIEQPNYSFFVDIWVLNTQDKSLSVKSKQPRSALSEDEYIEMLKPTSVLECEDWLKRVAFK